MNVTKILISTLGLAAALALSSCRATDDLGRQGGGNAGVANASASQPGTGTARVAGSAGPERAASGVDTSGMSWRAQALPSGDERTSAVLLRKGYPIEVQRGIPFEYVIEVANLTDHKLEDVMVTDRIPAELKIHGSQPTMQGTKDGVASWVFAELAPGAKQRIVVSGSADKVGPIKSCASVTYASLVCSAITVVESSLALTKEAPSEITVCEKIPVKYTITNTGTGTANDIVITESLPANLTTADKQPLRFRVETLGPKQSKEFLVKLDASQPGTYSGAAEAKAAGNLTAKSAETTTIVRQPKLSITSEAPEQSYLDRELTQKITVTNIGDYEARDAKLEQNIPTGAKLVRATDGGRRSGDKVVWDLGTIAKNANRVVSATFLPQGSTVVSSTAKASAHCASEVAATAQTRLIGIAAILMEVVDLEDPIAVGEEETYEITITNQGSAPGTDIKIVCEMENSMTHVSSGGATAATVAGNTITFSPLASLAPKASVKWRVKVRSNEAADARFKVTMTSGQSQRPTSETESTRFYK